MRRSLSEYVPLLLHLWQPLLVGGLATIIGGGLALASSTGWTLVTVPYWVGRTIWISGPIITLLMAQFLAFHRVRIEREKLRRQVEELCRNCPVIQVELPDPHETAWLLGRYALIVSNHGAAAVVSAQVKVTEGLDYIQAYYQDTFTALWEDNTDSVRLMNGQRARMQLIEPDLNKPTSPPHFSQWRIPRWDGKGASHLETTSWLTFGSSPPPELTFEVTISADPSDPSGPAIRRYRLDGQGLRDIG